jgi:hypothetical protein
MNIAVNPNSNSNNRLAAPDGGNRDLAPRVLSNSFTDRLAPPGFDDWRHAPLQKVLSNAMSFLCQDLYHTGSGRGLRKSPWGCSIDLDPKSPISAYDTAPYQTAARAYSPSFMESFAVSGAVLDRFWLGLSPGGERTIAASNNPERRLFFLRYQPMALDLVRNHFGQRTLRILRSAGNAILERGIPDLVSESSSSSSDALRRKANILEQGIRLCGDQSVRIPPALVNELAPRLDTVANFVIELGNALPISDLHLDRGQQRDSILSPHSSRLLVYHLALTIGALSDKQYREVLRATPNGRVYTKHLSECINIADIAASAALLAGPREISQSGGSQPSSFPITVHTNRLNLLSAANPLLQQEVALQNIDALRACGTGGVDFWADVGERVSEKTSSLVHERPLDLFSFNLHAGWLRARDICAQSSL